MGYDDYDDNQSYQDQLDQRFYKGEQPRNCLPFTFEDLCETVFRFVNKLIGLDLIVLITYHLTGSITKTCLKCAITPRTFYRCRRRLMRRFGYFMNYRNM